MLEIIRWCVGELGLEMVRFRFQSFEPDSGRDSIRFDSGSNLTEPDLHDSAKSFLFWMHKTDDSSLFFTVIYRCFGHYIQEQRIVAISLVKSYEYICI